MKKKPDALIINPKEGHTYAEILKNLRNKVTTHVKIMIVRKARNGPLLLELAKGEKISEKLSDAIKDTLLGTANVRELTPQATIEITDLDSYITGDEVVNAIRALLNDPSAETTVKATGPENLKGRP